MRWFQSGLTPEVISNRCRVSVRTVQLGLARARAYKAWIGVELIFTEIPRLHPYFGNGFHTPDGPCAHRSDWNSREHPFVCMACHSSYYDGHPDFWRDPLTDPAPVGKLPPKVEHEIQDDTSLTRRQKGRILRRWILESFGKTEDAWDLGVDIRELIGVDSAELIARKKAKSALVPQPLAQISP